MPPAIITLSKKASTASRLSTDSAYSASVVRLVSEMARSLMNDWNLLSVSSMKKMLSSMTMLAAVSSVNCGLKVKPSAEKKAVDLSKSRTAMLMKIEVFIV